MAAQTADIVIIGAGMAGASLAAAIGGRANVVVLEAENQPGYHSTGRSAAFWSESYGGPAVQPLTTASEAALGPYLSPRGCLHIADRESLGELEALQAEFAGKRPQLERIDRDRLHGIVPGLDGRFIHALLEATCQDIDVARLHAESMKISKVCGSNFVNDAMVHGVKRGDGAWTIDTTAGVWQAPIIVNAAGAWATHIGHLAGASPIAITPYRRTVVQLRTDPAIPADMPMIMDAAGRFYFKPEAGGRLWVSPHDEHPNPPQDVAPEEIDVAIAIDRFEHAVDWRVLKRERAWAGLRSFAPDRIPIYGFDGLAAGFFWFAGQGGFGIQTAPAAAEIGAALLLDSPLPPSVSEIDVERYSPSRFDCR